MNHNNKSKLKNIQIGNKIIGVGKPCFIIAEAGVNHNGSFLLAKKLVDAAVRVKADAVKFQIVKASEVVTKKAGLLEYQTKNAKHQKTQYELIKELELTSNNFIKLKEHCDKKGIIFLASFVTPDAVDVMGNLVPAFKIASPDLTNDPLIKKIALKKKPLIVSTGMATLEEVKKAKKIIEKTGNNKIIILHCTSSYPCPFEEVNLNAMLTLRNELNCFVGYSDHTVGITVPIMAVTLGASVIEKHFTLDKNLPGPDHKASLEPNEFLKMVKEIRIAEKALGDETKRASATEKKNMLLIRKSIVAVRPILKGEKIVEEMLAMKRPGTGLKPSEIHKILNKLAIVNIEEDKLISVKMVK